MKKIGNKGFAISTVIYGLSIMAMLIIIMLLAILSSERTVAKKVSDIVKDDLVRFSRTEVAFNTSTDASGFPKPQEFVVPHKQSGWYRIELWGAGGASSNGAYTSGIIELNEGEVLYFYVGKQVGNFGTETDVRLVSGGYNDETSYSSRIMVAAGGGNGTNAGGGTIIGYPQASSLSITDARGTLIYTGAPRSSSGGDGYYPGANANTGGASFISGYAGCKAKISNVVQDSPIYKFNRRYYDENDDSYHYTNENIPIYFMNGKMIGNVNNGVGYARIEKLILKGGSITELPRHNSALINPVRCVQDCVQTTSSDNNEIWKSYELIMQGDKVVASKSYGNSGGKKCLYINLNSQVKLDEVAIWHGNIDYRNESLRVSSNACSSWNDSSALSLKTDTSNIEKSETITGSRVSAYDYSYTDFPTKGNYYIRPLSHENLVVSAGISGVSLTNLRGYNKQRWSVELIRNTNISTTGDEYKIFELATNRALENVSGNAFANDFFNNETRNGNQIWKVQPYGDGTYSLILADNPAYCLSVNASNQLILSSTCGNKQSRFEMIPIDYSSID